MHDSDAVRDALTLVTFRNREQRQRTMMDDEGKRGKTRMPVEQGIKENHNQCDETETGTRSQDERHESMLSGAEACQRAQVMAWELIQTSAMNKGRIPAEVRIENWKGKLKGLWAIRGALTQLRGR